MNAVIENLKHPHIEAGDCCPGCSTGKFYPQNPPQVTSLIAYRPGFFIKRIIKQEVMRCNRCGVRAANPDPTPPGTHNGFEPEASASIVVSTFQGGVPNHRLAAMFSSLGFVISKQRINELLLSLGEAFESIYLQILQRIAQANLICTDDTSFNIVDVKNQPVDPNYKQGSPKPPSERSSSRASVVLGYKGEQLIAAAFDVSQLHCGEFLEEILNYRNNPEQPVVMADMLTQSDTPTYKLERAHLKKKPSEMSLDDLQYIRAGCNDHLLRHLKEAERNYPRLNQLVVLLQQIYEYDSFKKDWLIHATPEQLLAFRKEFMLGRFEKMKQLAQDFLLGTATERKAEPNSSEGKVLRYLLSHYEAFTALCRSPHACLANSCSERALKKFIILRKNSWFFQTVKSAHKWSVLASLVYTADNLGLNPAYYITDLLKNLELAKNNPEDWDPLGYMLRKQREGPLPRSAVNDRYSGSVLETG